MCGRCAGERANGPSFDAILRPGHGGPKRTQALARRAGLTPPRISQIESGEGSNGPTYAVIRKIARACGIDWTRLVRQGLATVAAEAPAATAPVSPAAPARISNSVAGLSGQ